MLWIGSRPAGRCARLTSRPRWLLGVARGRLDSSRPRRGRTRSRPPGQLEVGARRAARGSMSDSGRTLPATSSTLLRPYKRTPPNFISGRTLPGLFGGQFARVAWCIMGQKGGERERQKVPGNPPGARWAFDDGDPGGFTACIWHDVGTGWRITRPGVGRCPTSWRAQRLHSPGRSKANICAGCR